MSAPMRDFDALVSRPSPWLDGGGPKSDIVVSTRVRLARNLRHVPFSHRAQNGDEVDHGSEQDDRTSEEEH